ncbi:hypothetical protein NL676_019315 [Syzygium grande]|nr:hypothetical protein NL676_019315 [Syzygium grande]
MYHQMRNESRTYTYPRKRAVPPFRRRRRPPSLLSSDLSASPPLPSSPSRDPYPGLTFSGFGRYLTLLAKYPVATKAVTSALLTFLGDLICQLVIDQAPSLDLKRNSPSAGVSGSYASLLVLILEPVSNCAWCIRSFCAGVPILPSVALAAKLRDRNDSVVEEGSEETLTNINVLESSPNMAD